MARFELIAELLGLELAEEFADRFGGTSLYVPSRPDLAARNRAVAALGIEAARRLAVRFGGERIDVPVLPKRHKILELFATGMGTREIALALRITVRRVQQVLAEPATRSKMKRAGVSKGGAKLDPRK